MCRATTFWRRSGGATASLVLLAGLLAGPLAGQPVRGGALPALFPPDNWWNVDVSAAPLDPASTSIIGYIQSPYPTPRGLHPDFGGDDEDAPPGIYGMVYMTVGGDEPLEQMAFDYADQSDDGAPGRPPGYPIPVEAKTEAKWIEGGYPGNADVGGDKHLLIVDRDNRLLYETWNTRCVPAGSPACTWEAGSGAVWSLGGNGRRPFGWTSGDAAGLAILPGLVRYDETYAGTPIPHAFRVTVRGVNGFVYPASHEATTSTNPSAPALGTRLRLRADFAPASYPSGATPADRAAMDRVVAAMKRHGLIVADTGSDLYVSGAYDTRWNNDLWNPFFAGIRAVDFEVVERGWGSSRFVPVLPCRLLDTRNAPGQYGGPALGAMAERAFVVAERCGLPASVRSIAGNLTVVNPSASGRVQLFPGDRAAGLAAPLSYSPGKTRANNFLSRLSGRSESTDWGTVVLRNDGSQPVHVIVDVSGYFE